MGAAITTFAESGLAEMGFHISPRSSALVKGEEVWLTFEMRWSTDVRLPMLPCGADPDIWTEVVYQDGQVREWMNGQAPLRLPKRPPVDWKAGEPLKGEISVLPLCEPGEYRLRLHYRLHTDWPDRNQYWDGQVVSNWVQVTILEPQGEDLQVWQNCLRAVPKKDCQAFRNWYLSQSSFLLARYPTSTYAGYVLVKLGGGMSLEEASRVTPEVRDQVWYVPTGASREKQEEHRRMVRKKYEEFVSQARTFLAAHPDFSQRAL
ncbi:MAG: hypothetical protein AB1700_18960, partial [Bacillota bacterium]